MRAPGQESHSMSMPSIAMRPGAGLTSRTCTSADVSGLSGGTPCERPARNTLIYSASQRHDEERSSLSVHMLQQAEPTSEARQRSVGA